MKYKTRGIVFNYIKFRETSIIARIYTEKYGLKNYLINNVRSTKPTYPISLFQPLTQLDMIVYNKLHAEINRVSEIKCLYPYHSIPYDILKSAVCLFLTEIIYKILREEEPNQELFEFILNSFKNYDKTNSYNLNFHLHFLLKLTNYLGIAPMDVDDIINEIKSMGSNYRFTENDRKIFNVLLKNSFNDLLKITNENRRNLLNLIILFYRKHFDYISEIKSYKILQEVFEK